MPASTKPQLLQSTFSGSKSVDGSHVFNLNETTLVRLPNLPNPPFIDSSRTTGRSTASHDGDQWPSLCHGRSMCRCRRHRLSARTDLSIRSVVRLGRLGNLTNLSVLCS